MAVPCQDATAPVRPVVVSLSQLSHTKRKTDVLDESNAEAWVRRLSLAASVLDIAAQRCMIAARGS